MNCSHLGTLSLPLPGELWPTVPPIYRAPFRKCSNYCLWSSCEELCFVEIWSGILTCTLLAPPWMLLFSQYSPYFNMCCVKSASCPAYLLRITIYECANPCEDGWSTNPCAQDRELGARQAYSRENLLHIGYTLQMECPFGCCPPLQDWGQGHSWGYGSPGVCTTFWEWSTYYV